MSSIVLAALTLTSLSSFDRIERAHAAGEIDAPTRALFALRALRAPERLPERFRPLPGESRPRCATAIFHDAFARLREMEPGMAAEVHALSARPTSIGYVQAATQPIRVHYADNGDAARAAEVAGYADESWDLQTGEMGFRVPPTDGSVGGSGDYDIYLERGLGYAYAAPESEYGATAWSDATSYVVIDPAVTPIESFVAHELNHSSQFAYDYAEALLIYEATATFIEDKVYDEVDDYVWFVADFQGMPSRTLSYASYDDTYMYGAAVWLHYLADVYDGGGTDLVRDIWEGSKQEGALNTRDYFESLEGGLLESVGLDDLRAMYADFAAYRWLAGDNDDGTIDEAGKWDEVDSVTFDLSDLGESADLEDADDPPMTLGANYYEVEIGGAGNDGDSLALTVAGDDDTAWGVTVLKIPESGEPKIEVYFDEDEDGALEVEVRDTAELERVVFAVLNLGDGPLVPDDLGESGHISDVSEYDYDYALSYRSDADDSEGKNGLFACDAVVIARLPGGRSLPIAETVLLLAGAAFGAILRRRR